MKPLSKKSLVSKAARTQDFWSNPVFPEDTRWMRAAIMVAQRGIGRSGVNPPVGCVLIGADGQLLASCHTGAGGVPHAESAALASLDDAGRIALQGGTAYVTLEPCAMCLGAMMHARIARIVYGANDQKSGVCGSSENLINANFFNHKIHLTNGILEDECKKLLKKFFNLRR